MSMTSLEILEFYFLAITADWPHLTILRSFVMNRGKVDIAEDVRNIQNLSTTIKE